MKIEYREGKAGVLLDYNERQARARSTRRRAAGLRRRWVRGVPRVASRRL